MSRVLVDADVLGRRRTGDETYVTQLLSGLATSRLAGQVEAVTRHPELVPPGITPVRLPARSSELRMVWSLPRLLRRRRPDLAHFQYVIPPGWRGRSAVTVHDLSFERRGDLMGRADRTLMRTLVPRAVRRADLVLTVSEFSKADLVECYRADPGRIVVTPNGVDEIFSPTGDRPSGAPYLLFVGALQPRKNPVLAVEALAALGGHLRMLLVGPHKAGLEEVRAAITRLGLDSRVELLGHVDRPRLAALYRGAECLVFPSSYEGFGLPVLEAMASGTPVVASDTTALPEVAGDAAVLVPLGDPEVLAGGIARALADRDRLRAAGLERAAGFTWAALAERTVAAYEEVLS
ncbi:MAG TPA: glycosyltransferase family 1 protein [Mycobacteriales bacterium]